MTSRTELLRARQGISEPKPTGSSEPSLQKQLRIRAGINSGGNGGLSYPIIQPTQEPETETWAFPPLYKGSSGKQNEQLWIIGFDGRELVSRWGFTHTETDYQTTSVEVTPKGKRSLQEQALQEARYKYQLKYRAGYRRKGQKTPTLVKLMKGQPYKPGKTVLSERFGIELKIDGIRGSMHLAGKKVMYISYGNKPMRAFPHLDDWFKELLIWLPNNSIIDFEFYNHDLDFNQIQSIVTTRKHTHAELNKIQGWVFDYCCSTCSEPYEIRRKRLEIGFAQLEQSPLHFQPARTEADSDSEDEFEALDGPDESDANEAAGVSELVPEVPEASSGTKVGPRKRIQACPLVLIPQWIGRTERGIQKIMNYALEEGYEGVVLKRMACDAPSSSQAYKRSLYCTTGSHSTHIYKYKKMLETEGIICGFDSAKGREKGLVMWHVLDRHGNRIRMRMEGTFAQRQEWFERGAKYIGKILNFEYQELSADRVPRFPVGRYFRDPGDLSVKDLLRLERVLAKYQATHVRHTDSDDSGSDSDASDSDDDSTSSKPSKAKPTRKRGKAIDSDDEIDSD